MGETCVARSHLAAPADEVFAWHERPGAFERFSPPWEQVRVIAHEGTIRDGDRTVLRMRVGPISRRWVAVHRDYRAGRQFRDVQIEGPFARWEHTHLVEPAGANASTLIDRIEYALPLGALGQTLAGSFARARLGRLFAYRHATLAADLARHRTVGGGRRLRIAITGANGFLGRALSAFLSTGGHQVIPIVRGAPELDAIHWDPERGQIDAQRLDGIDAVIHLAGEPIGKERWSAEPQAPHPATAAATGPACSPRPSPPCPIRRA